MLDQSLAVCGQVWVSVTQAVYLSGKETIGLFHCNLNVNI